MSKQISLEEFDRRFDDGDPLTEYWDESMIRHPNRPELDVLTAKDLKQLNAIAARINKPVNELVMQAVRRIESEEFDRDPLSA